MKKINFKTVRKYIIPLLVIIVIVALLVSNRSKASEITDTSSVVKSSLTVKNIISCDTNQKVAEPLEVFVGGNVKRTNPNSIVNALDMKNLPAGTADGSPIMNQFSFFGLDSKQDYKLTDDSCADVNFINMKEGNNYLSRMKVKKDASNNSSKNISAATTIPRPALNTPQNGKVGETVSVTINSAERLDNSIIKWKDICGDSSLPSNGWKTLWAVKSDNNNSEYVADFIVPNLAVGCKIYFIADVSNEYGEVLVPQNGLEDTNIPFLTVAQ